MISFDTFKPDGLTPVYLQIIRHIKQGIIAGSIADQDEMPSRRMLSALLGVNPNTIQKAYHMLEEEGLITSRSGAISYVTIKDSTLRSLSLQLSTNEALTFINAMKQMGITKEEALGLISSCWEEDAFSLPSPDNTGKE